MDTKGKRDYTKINSRINTNLNGPKAASRFMRDQGEDDGGYNEETQEENINYFI